MQLIIRDTNYIIVNIIEDIESLIWNTRYNDVGEFEFVVSPENKNIMPYIQFDYFVCRNGIMEVGIIEEIEFTNNTTDGDICVVKGRFIESILERRIIWTITNLSGGVVDVINRFVMDACGENEADPPVRRIPGFMVGSLVTGGEVIDIQRTGDTVLDVVVDLCKTYDYGFRIDRLSVNELYFVVYRGKKIDVVFTEEFDNLLASKFTRSTRNYRTSALVAGEGEGEERKQVILWGNAEGWSRRELYVDARDLQMTEGMALATYEAMLRQRGTSKLIEHRIAELLDADIDISNYTFRTDFNVGDVVTIRSSRWGFSINARIVEVSEVLDDKGFRIVPTFVEWKGE